MEIRTVTIRLQLQFREFGGVTVRTTLSSLSYTYLLTHTSTGRKLDLVYFYLISLNDIRRHVRDVWEGVFTSSDDLDSQTSLPIRAFGLKIKQDTRVNRDPVLFARLGCEAIKITKSKMVFAFGGGDTTLHEYMFNQENRSDILWKVWPVSRIRDGNLVEACHLTELRGRPNVQFMFNEDSFSTTSSSSDDDDEPSPAWLSQKNQVGEEISASDLFGGEKKDEEESKSASDLFDQETVFEKKEEEESKSASDLFDQETVFEKKEEEESKSASDHLFDQERTASDLFEKKDEERKSSASDLFGSEDKMTASDLFGGSSNVETLFENAAPATPSNDKSNNTMESVRIIQSRVRGRLVRKRYEQEVKARKLQSIVRGRMARRRFSQERAALRVQTIWRGKSERIRHEERKNSNTISSLVDDITSTNLDMLILEQEREHEEAQKATTEALAVLHELELLETGDEEKEIDDDELVKLRQECVELTERLGDVEKELRATKKRERVTNNAYASEISDLRLELKSEREHRERLEDEIRILKTSSTTTKKKDDLHLELKSERDHRNRLEDEIGKLRVQLTEKKKGTEKKKETAPTITVPTQVKLKEEDILDEEELQNRIAEKEVELAIASGVRSITRFFW